MASKTSTLTIEVNTVLRNSIRDLEKVEAILDRLNRTISIGADTTGVKVGAKEAERLIKSVPERKDTTIDANIALAEANVTKLNLKLEELTKKPHTAQTDADIAVAQARLGTLQAQIDRLTSKKNTVTIDVDTETLGAKFTKLEQDVTKSLGSMSTGMGSFVGAINGAGTAAAGLGAGIQVGAVAVQFLGSALTQLSGLAGVAAGALLGIGTVAATLKVGLDGVADGVKLAFTEDDPKKFAKGLAKLPPEVQKLTLELQKIKPIWADIQATVQKAIFAGVIAEVKSLAGTYLPVLKTGMADVATAINGVIKEISGFAKEKQTVADVGTAFSNSAKLVDNLGKAVQPILQILRDVGTVGLQAITDLSGGVGAATTKWAAFIEQARATGQLRTWIDNAIQGVKDLAATVGNIGTIFKAVFTPLAGQFDASLGSLRALTDQMVAFVQSAQVQGSLQQLGEFLSNTLKSAIDLVRTAWEQLSPAFQAALPFIEQTGAAIHDGLVTALEILGPILKVVGDLLSALAPVLSPVIGAVIAVGGAFKLLGLALSPLVSVVGVIATNFSKLGTSAAASTSGVTSAEGAVSRLSGVVSKAAAALPLLGAAVILVGEGWKATTGDAEGWAKAILAGGSAATSAAAALAAHNAKTQDAIISNKVGQVSQAAMNAEIQKQLALLSPLEQAQAKVNMAQTALNEAYKVSASNGPAVVKAQQDLTAASQALESQQNATTQAARSATQVTKDQLAAVQSLTNASLGYSGSLLNVESAAKTAAEAIKLHGAKSLEARQAVQSLKEASEGSAAAAQRQAEALTANLSPLQKAEAGSAAYAARIANLAATTSGPAQQAALSWLKTTDDATLSMVTAASEASNLEKKIVTLPNGKKITVTADASQIPQVIADYQKKFAAAPGTPEVKPNLGPVLPALDAAKQTALGNPLLPAVTPTTTGVPPLFEFLQKDAAGKVLAPQVTPTTTGVPQVLTGVQQQATGAPMAPPMVPDVTKVGPALTGVQQQAATTPVSVPVSADTALATTNLTALRDLITSINTQVTTLNTSLTGANGQLVPLVTNLTNANAQLLPAVTNLTNLNAQLVPLVTNLTNANAQFAPLVTGATNLNTQLTPMATSLTTINAQLLPMVTNLTNINAQLLPMVTSWTNMNVQLLPMVTNLTNMNTQLLPMVTNWTNLNVQLLPAVTNFTNINAQLLPLVTNLTNLNAQLVPMVTNWTNLATQLTNFSSIALQAVIDKIAELLAAVQRDFPAIEAAIKTSMDNSTATVQAATQAMYDAWLNMLNAMISTFNDAIQIIADIMNILLDYLEALYPVFDAIGQNFGISLANGMRAQVQNVYNAGVALGQAATAGVNAGMVSGSPSKAALDAGGNFGNSLVMGMDRTQSAVYASAEALGKMATAGANSSLAALAVPTFAAGGLSGQVTGSFAGAPVDSGADSTEGGDTIVQVQIGTREITDIIDKRIVRNNTDRRRAAVAQRKS